MPGSTTKDGRTEMDTMIYTDSPEALRGMMPEAEARNQEMAQPILAKDAVQAAPGLSETLKRAARAGADILCHRRAEELLRSVTARLAEQERLLCAMKEQYSRNLHDLRVAMLYLDGLKNNENGTKKHEN